MAGQGTDQIEPQRLDEALAKRTGIDGGWVAGIETDQEPYTELG